MSKNEADHEQVKFDPGSITELSDDLAPYNYALRTLGELLDSADLEDVGQADNVGWGMRTLIELCVDKQEEIIDRYIDAYRKSDGYLINQAKIAILPGYSSSREKHIEKLSRSYDNIKMVIARGGDLKDKALELKKTIERQLKEYGKGV
jgi:hypothetical protein